MFKKIFLLILILFVLLQLWPRPAKNKGPETGNEISKLYPVPEDVMHNLKTACYDCHSNNTNYPWYASIQPVALWLDDHVKDGKKEVNFSEFRTYNLARQFHKLEEIGEQVKEQEMPLTSYTLIHRNAKLNEADRLAITNWAEATRALMRETYPADSLVRKRKT